MHFSNIIQFWYHVNYCTLYESRSVLSSTEFKAQASFPDLLLSVVRLLTFTFYFFLKNHWASFNQTLHKASLVLFKWKASLFPRVDNNEIAKFKNIPLQNHRALFNLIWHKAFLGEGDSKVSLWSNVGPTWFKVTCFFKNPLEKPWFSRLRVDVYSYLPQAFRSYLQQRVGTVYISK